MTAPAHVTRTRVLGIAWPIVLANAAVPLLGLADTAVIGRVGRAVDLGAIALGALLLSFLYWSFGFLRMGTTGFTAQAAGAGDEPEVRAALARALLLAAAAGLALLALQIPAGLLAFRLLHGSEAVEALARDYFSIRIWGAPATLATFALLGLFVGLGASRLLLIVQLVLNGINIALDVLFAGVLGWGVRGIALGTLIAEWSALIVALALAGSLLAKRRTDDEPFWPLTRVRDLGRLGRTLSANADIMVRTLFLLFGFAWFTDQSARFGDTLLAANHVLLQLVSFAAFFLDGFAFAGESLVGAAVGARRLDRFDAAVRHSSELAAATAVVLAGTFLALGEPIVRGLTVLEPVREAALRHLPFAAGYVLVSFAAFQLDGIFIGATRTRDMRNASIASLLLFLAAWWPLSTRLGSRGLWIAFILYVIARAFTLGMRYPALRAAVAAPSDPAPAAAARSPRPPG
ncbi:MAG TPA: MATE family efflux transporter [Thermoanaerobaculia bacterium]|nr:MATE family efflux transporter [Thermoanaerobaculia bacterium]